TGSFSSSVALLLGLCSVNLKKAYWGVLAILFAAFVAFARVYLFVHFTSDVVVGAILGIIMGIIAWAIARALSRMKVLEKIFNYSYKGKF
ncbi:MAG: phosphatase PAP2 family protein, partial [Veillonella sp.]|nr:phosphatase PAP2 family protein [Veillonella sp.]